MRQFLVCSALLGSLIPAMLWAEPPTKQEQFFEARVRPLLEAKCLECHSDQKQESSLRLDSREAILAGGDSGSAAISGNPAESLIVEAVRRDGLEMPPDEPLSDDEITIFERWVRMGLPWPATDPPPAPALGDQEQIAAAAAGHWSLQPIRQPDIPTVEREEWVQTPVDAFILARLEAHGLQPAPPADPRTLLRRAWFDVVGLPPPTAEIDRFVDRANPAAFEQVVEDLLASEHYGERWGRYWLDLARYADTRDWRAQTDIRYPFAYTYRDYVIRSLNEDKPYDRFLREQIAADFYTDDPQDQELAALGFLTVGPRFRNNQLEQIADQIDVVTRGLMAVTVTCAQCHDHKYDPIPTADYYALYGVFASAEEAEEYPEIAVDTPPSDLLEDYRQQYGEKVRDLEEYGETLRDGAIEDLRRRVAVYFTSYYEMSITRTSQIRGAISKHEIKETAMTPLVATLDRLRRGRDRSQDPVWGPWVEGLELPEPQFKKRSGEMLERWTADDSSLNPILLEAMEANRPATRAALIDTYAHAFQDVLDAQQADDADRDNRSDGEKGDRSSAANPDRAAQQQILSALLGERGVFSFTTDSVVAASRLLGKGRKKLGDLEKAIREVDVTHPGAPPRAMVLVDRPEPVEPFVMLRGEPRRRGPDVARRFLSVLGGDDDQPFVEGSGRKELAEAITAPDNPLTARVLVNRVWMRYFGEGLVESADDFGLRTAPPTHPELLDWLAASFIENGWSLKWLHGIILNSATYQQSSAADVSSAEIDPENYLLSHQRRKRLDFEAFRDALLSASGEIDLAVGGRSVRLSDEPFSTRRTVYAYIDRVDLDPMLKTFDFASPTAPAASRAETTIPQQSLFVMNHPFVIEQARRLAEHARPGDESSVAAGVERLYRRLFGRHASDAEAEMAIEFVKNAPAASAPSSSPWRYGFGPAEQAGDAEALTPLSHWSGQAYQVGAEFPDPRLGHLRLSAVGGTPGRNLGHAVIRRWIAPADATIAISGELKHARDKGDGIRARIVAEEAGELSRWTLFNDSTETDVEKVTVRAGQAIDFVVDCRKHAAADAFIWTPVIRSLDGPTAGTRWDARRDFAGPPPPPLDAWEQLAQALLLTNEFTYLD